MSSKTTFLDSRVCHREDCDKVWLDYVLDCIKEKIMKFDSSVESLIVQIPAIPLNEKNLNRLKEMLITRLLLSPKFKKIEFVETLGFHEIHLTF